MFCWWHSKQLIVYSDTFPIPWWCHYNHSLLCLLPSLNGSLAAGIIVTPLSFVLLPKKWLTHFQWLLRILLLSYISVQTSPLTVTPVTVTQYSYSDTFFPKKLSQKCGYSDTPLTVTVWAIPKPLVNKSVTVNNIYMYRVVHLVG